MEILTQLMSWGWPGATVVSVCVFTLGWIITTLIGSIGTDPMPKPAQRQKDKPSV